jgi:hypothetical protein
MTATYSWYESYRAAVLETDWTKMPERIKAAKSQVHERQRMLSEDHGGTAEERHAIALALVSLKALHIDANEWRKNQVSKGEQGLAPA